MIKNKDKNRPSIETAIVTNNMSEFEVFQNQTLRPIIKMQHTLLLTYFDNYKSIQKFVFSNLTELEKNEFIHNSFKKDLHLRNQIIGIVIGQFTLEEYLEYKNVSKELNKRMIDMIKERIITSI